MQTRAQSLLEVTVDYLFSVVMNIGGQLLFYPTLATTRRVTIFAVTLLGLAFLRRLLTRRLFEAFVPPGVPQPQWQSVLEAVGDTLVGFGIAVIVQKLVYGDAATLLRAGGFTFGIYGLTMLRRYLLRRAFVALAKWTARRQASPAFSAQ
jgi:hypothetical protein